MSDESTNQAVQNTAAEKPFLAALAGKASRRPPFWFMRQAGRYLPEYRELRAKAGSFLDLVYNPEMACEVTLQPIRRFGMDAAILFSDILVVPQGLGQGLKFVENEGPKLDAIRQGSALPHFSASAFDAEVGNVYETIRLIRSNLAEEGFNETALIGFAGSPWTVACYMVEGGGSREFINIKRWAYGDPESFGMLIDTVTDATVYYLMKQIEAGAEALQLFDSWAGILDENLFTQWVINPTRKIVAQVRSEYPDIPIIGFPRGAGRLYLDYVQNTDVSALGLDYQVPVKWAATALQAHKPVQGNLDPMCLLEGGDTMAAAVEKILATLCEQPFIFNLGHGVHKDTPPENVEKLTQMIRDWV